MKKVKINCKALIVSILFILLSGNIKAQYYDIKVTFNNMKVDNDCDPGWKGGKGEFYWTFSVNGKQVLHRPSNRYISISDGTDYPFGAAPYMIRGLKKGQTLTISGFVNEKDDMDPDDRAGTFNFVYTIDEKFGTEKLEQTRLNQSGCDVTVFIKIDSVKE